jgi:hypothetical protein
MPELGTCPRPFYGPEDHEESCDPRKEQAARESAIETWKASYHALPWWKMVVHFFRGYVEA